MYKNQIANVPTHMQEDTFQNSVYFCVAAAAGVTINPSELFTEVSVCVYESVHGWGIRDVICICAQMGKCTSINTHIYTEPDSAMSESSIQI